MLINNDKIQQFSLREASFSGGKIKKYRLEQESDLHFFHETKHRT
jgi:hypothetical protein